MSRPAFQLLPLAAALCAVSVSLSSHAAERTHSMGTVDVVGEQQSDTRPVKGYNAKQSRTATKTDTALIDVPQSVTVVPQDLIKDMSLQSVSEVVQYVPGVQASQGEGNRDAVNFRGAGVSTGDFYLDGMRDDVQTYRDLYNTDRIEVLKGANAMIFGRGGAGGVINRVSKEAGWDPVREISLSYGSWDHRRSTLDVGSPVNDNVALRLNAVYEDSHSYRDGVDLKRYGLTPTMTLRPSEQTKVVLSAEYFNDQRIGDRGVPSVNGAGNSSLGNRPWQLGETDTFWGNAAQSPNETDTHAFNALVEHEFNNGVTLRNRLRYADYDKYYQNVYITRAMQNDGNVRIGAYRDETERENLINQTDLLYTLHTGSITHKLLLGTEFGQQDTDNRRLIPQSGETLGNVTAANPTYNGPVSFTKLSRDRQSEADIAAVYLQDQVLLSDQWELVLGLRQDRFKVDHRDNLANTQTNTTDDKLSPRAGLIFKPIENVSLYASYSETFVPRAGDQVVDLTPSSSALSPEKFINHEVGAKWDITPALAVTAALYQLERQNVAIQDPSNPTQSILVDGQQTQGFELGVSGNITEQWSMFGGYAWQDGEITEAQGTGSSAIAEGAELAQTPEETFSLWNRYDLNDRWGVALGMISRAQMYAAVPTASQSTLLPGYTRFDAAVYHTISEDLALQVNVENLTNKEYAQSAHNNNNIVPGAPLNARATLIYSF